jgi:hypothetical protein
MTLEIKHSFTSLKSDGVDTTVVQPSDWNAAHAITMAAGRLLGRDTSGAGAAQELPVAVTSAGNMALSATGYFKGAVGTTAQRLGSPEAGMSRWNSTTTKREEYDGSDWVNMATEAYVASYGTSTIVPLIDANIPAGLLYGLTLSTAGSSTTFSVAAGRAADKTNAKMLALASAMSKTTSVWAAGSGNGGIDGGSAANDTWYHVFLIAKADLSAVDVFASTSLTPTLPATYTLSRRIGSIKTNGSGQWKSFLQIGDDFFIPSVQDAFVGAQALTLTALSVPTGVVVRPLISGVATTNNNDAVATVAPGSNSAIEMPLVGCAVASAGPVNVTGPAVLGPPTNTSRQIYLGLTSASSGAVVLNTHGWVDRRGQDG